MQGRENDNNRNDKKPNFFKQIFNQKTNNSVVKSNQPIGSISYSVPKVNVDDISFPQRPQSYFYDPSCDCYGFTRFRKNENPVDTGCQLYWIRPGTFQESHLPEHPCNDKAYIFVESKNQLLYGNRNQFEEIKINDLIKFQEIFKAIMNNEYQYNYKHLTYEEIRKLITLNTGHIPSREIFPNPTSIETNEVNSNSLPRKKDK